VDRVVSHVDELLIRVGTPALMIDLPTVARNVERLAAYASAHGLRLRPHTKTHKSLRMARLQISAGCQGITTAKVGEALAMSEASRDLLVAYPAIDPYRSARLAELARHARVCVALDGIEGARVLAAAAVKAGSQIGVLVDLDVGFHRTGTQSPPASLALAQQISASAGLRLDGLFFYPGHVWSPALDQAQELERIDGLLSESIDLWRRAGLEVRTVSGGSTPTAYQSHLLTAQTEIRPGTYIYNDMNTARAGFCAIEDCAARIVCTVVSDAVPGKVVIDGGTKTFTSDRNVTAPDGGFGHVVEYPQAIVARLSEEHGELDVSACPTHPRVGERLSVIPNHICPCINLRDEVWLQDGDGTLEPMAVDTRGKLA
jgi:D-serine deaminase-like pyridoxal phosphate-dependent protein